MELEKTKINIKCDTLGCNNKAEYTLMLKKYFGMKGTNFCHECITNIYKLTSGVVVPKSPKNVLIKKKNLKEDNN